MKQVFLAFLALILVTVFGLATSSFPIANSKGSESSLSLFGAVTKNADIKLSEQEKDLSLFSKGIKWTPDGHITYVTLPNNIKRFFLSGNQKTYTVDTKANSSLEEALANGATLKENFGPDKNVSYKNFYATINSVVQTDDKNLNHLMALAQYEEQAVKPDGTNDFANFTASIGLLESYDGGNTWKDFGPVIKGDDYIAPGTKITGAGEPSAVINNGYIYVYFVDWAAGYKVSHPDQIYLARTKIFPDGGLGAFEYLTKEGFSKTAENLKPVITVPDTNDAKYTSLPSVSYNKYLNQYLAVFESNNGFYQTVSKDGVSWAQTKQIIAFPKALSTRTDGDVWYSYPTLLSDASEKSDGSTKNIGNIYFAKGVWPNTAHQLTVKSFEFGN